MEKKNINDTICISLITLGETMVGKSSLISKYIDNIFEDNIVSTIGFDIKIKEIRRNNKNIIIKIWDTAGQERFNSIQKQYYKNIDGILLIFDLTNLNSFNNLNQWFEKIEKHSPKNCNIVLIGNKCDKEDEIEVKDDDIQKLIFENCGIKYFNTSAKSGFNVNECFDYFIDEIVKIKEENKNDETIIIKKKQFENNRKKKKLSQCCDT